METNDKSVRELVVKLKGVFESQSSSEKVDPDGIVKLKAKIKKLTEPFKLTPAARDQHCPQLKLPDAFVPTMDLAAFPLPVLQHFLTLGINRPQRISTVKKEGITQKLPENPDSFMNIIGQLLFGDYKLSYLKIIVGAVSGAVVSNSFKELPPQTQFDLIRHCVAKAEKFKPDNGNDTKRKLGVITSADIFSMCTLISFGYQVEIFLFQREVVDAFFQVHHWYPDKMPNARVEHTANKTIFLGNFYGEFSAPFVHTDVFDIDKYKLLITHEHMLKELENGKMSVHGEPINAHRVSQSKINQNIYLDCQCISKCVIIFCSFILQFPFFTEDLEELRKKIEAADLISTDKSGKFITQKVVPEITAKDLENLEELAERYKDEINFFGIYKFRLSKQELDLVRPQLYKNYRNLKISFDKYTVKEGRGGKTIVIKNHGNEYKKNFFTVAECEEEQGEPALL